MNSIELFLWLEAWRDVFRGPSEDYISYTSAFIRLAHTHALTAFYDVRGRIIIREEGCLRLGFRLAVASPDRGWFVISIIENYRRNTCQNIKEICGTYDLLRRMNALSR